MRVFVVTGLLFITGIASQAFSQAIPFKPLLVETSHVDAKGDIDTSMGKRTIELREIRTGASNNPKIQTHLVIVLFDPVTKIYSGEAIFNLDMDPNGEFITKYLDYVGVFFQGGQFHQFSVRMSPFQIEVHHFGAKATDLADASVQALARVWPQDLSLTSDPKKNLTIAPLPALEDFSAPYGSPITTTYPVVIGVKWNAGQWKLLVKGQWTEEITLDSNYKFLEMRKME